MASHRTRRVADLLRALISELLTRELQDPRLSSARITDVRVSPDLRHATFYFSVFPGGEAERNEAARAFARAEGWMKREVAARGGLRVVPGLRFVPDRTLEHAAHIDEVLRQVTPPVTPDPDRDPDPVEEPGEDD